MKDSPLWYNFDMSSETQYTRCIKQLEFMCRKSMSYNSWQKRTKYPVSVCPICSESFEFVQPQTHHHPRTLFSVVDSILQKHIDLEDLDDFTDFQICDEIMQAHFEKKVQYIVLCESCHKNYHSGVPSVLDIIDDLQIKQIQNIKDFYTKGYHGSADKKDTTDKT